MERLHVVVRKGDLTQAQLDGIDLSDLDLSGAVLSRATIGGCNLRLTRLSGADLRGATCASLMVARPDGSAFWLETDLRGADLSNADLRGANLSAALLDGVVLRGAVFDAETHWPPGFDPAARGALESRVRPTP